MPSQGSYRDALLRVISEVVAPEAASVDASGKFPRAQVREVPPGAGSRPRGGGAAFRKESVVERLFRDSRAARVMAPTTDALLDFVGRALLGLPLLGEA